MFPDQRAVIVLSSAALSMICCGCASRGSYDQLEPQSDSWDDVETLLARSAKPLVAGKGDLVCSIDSGTEKWDLVLFPMGDGTARFADLEVRVEFKDLRVRTADEDASYGLRALRLPGVSVTPGDRLRLLFYDIDDVFHERMDDVSVQAHCETTWSVYARKEPLTPTRSRNGLKPPRTGG